MSVNGPKIDRAELTAKNSPSDPVGASEAVHEPCRGLQNTSPIVMNTCHTHAPLKLGDLAINNGDNAMSQSPGINTEKSSLALVNAPTSGGIIKHPNRLILWMVYIGVSSPYLRSMNGGSINSDAVQFIAIVIVANPKTITLHVALIRKMKITCSIKVVMPIRNEVILSPPSI